ncbi:hypothetical protein IWW50_004631 [Coemansia erecta]|nr:hypothetical protein GGF43_000747 [Coemansia sp. RSA 2618]KAJ2821455.1 hypothetical protein IWW50_004631 [Coemansia erecta]
MDEETVDLPALGCLELRNHAQRGRGVFTRQAIVKGTLVHISPVLVFSKTEYSEHGKHTKLDDYTYCWKGGAFALALGLGCMFNHEPLGRENVGFVRDMDQALIKYVALRDIAAGEELCICYGPNVWFDVVSDEAPAKVASDSPAETADDFLGSIEL